MISIVYLTCRGPWPLASEKMRALGQYDSLSDSLRQQTFTDYELIVVDRCNVLPRPELYWLGNRVRYCRPRETPWDALWAKAISTARNTGLCEAKGETVLGLDDCVSFGPHFLALVASHAQAGCYLAPTLTEEILDPKTGAFKEWHTHPQWPDSAGGILAYPRQLALDLRGHEERFTGCHSLEDWEFSKRLTRNGMRLVHDDSEKITLYAHSFRIAHQQRCAWEVYGLLRGQPFANSKWTKGELAHFEAPVCGFLNVNHCEVADTGCQHKPRPTEAALNVMREYEGSNE